MIQTPRRTLKAGFLLLPALFFQIHTASALFSDVPVTHQQAKPIEVLQLRKVINGYPDQTFKPEKLITRGEFLKMAFNDIGFRQAPQGGKTPFADIPADSWIAPYANKALDLNVITAIGNQPAFRPADPLTRVEAIKMGFPIAGISAPYYTDISPDELFPDVRPNAWFAYLARAAKIHGVITVKKPNAFWPKHLMTRGDAAELIYQLQLARESAMDGHGGITVETPDMSELDAQTLELLNNPKFGILLDVWKKANTDFYYKENIDKDALVYGAIKGLVEKLGDQYTVFEEPSEALGLQQYLQGEFEGIGTAIDVIDKNIVIMKVFPNSPAEKANLQTGDVIKKINNQSLDNVTINEALNLIRGDAGTTVHLSITRNSQPLEIDLTRAKITLASVTGKMIGSIAYLSINEFTENSPTEFANSLTELAKQSPQGYIIDLRDNPGGYLDSATHMLGHFIPGDKTVVSTKSADGTTRNFQTSGQGELNGKPIIVLIDKGSASAAEIMAGAIQDFKVGKLLGTTTYGKGSVQEITNYTDDSLFKISTAHWLTPNGRDINGKGLTPDFIVEINQSDLLSGKDNQLNRAVEILNNRQL